MNNTIFNNSTQDDHLIYKANMVFMWAQVFNLSFGVPLNIYVIFFFTRAGGMDMIFTLCHCVSEIIFAFSLPQYILCAVNASLCSMKLLGFIVGFFTSARPIFQCCVCLEYYLAVVHPVTFLKFKPMRYRLACLLVIFVYVLFCSCSAMLTFPYMKFNITGSLYMIILGVDLFFCVSVLRALSQPGPGENAMARQRSGIRNSKMKAFKVVLINLLTFLMQTIPISIVFTFKPTDLTFGTFSFASAISVTINIGAGFVQVLFYLHNTGAFKCRSRAPN